MWLTELKTVPLCDGPSDEINIGLSQLQSTLSQGGGAMRVPTNYLAMAGEVFYDSL